MVPKEGQGLCVRTPSSGAHHVCPTAQDDLDEAKPETGPGFSKESFWGLYRDYRRSSLQVYRDTSGRPATNYGLLERMVACSFGMLGFAGSRARYDLSHGQHYLERGLQKGGRRT